MRGQAKSDPQTVPSLSRILCNHPSVCILFYTMRHAHRIVRTRCGLRLSSKRYRSKTNHHTLFRSVQRASVRETEGKTAGLTTLFGLVIGTERIKRLRNLR